MPRSEFRCIGCGLRLAGEPAPALCMRCKEWRDGGRPLPLDTISKALGDALKGVAGAEPTRLSLGVSPKSGEIVATLNEEVLARYPPLPGMRELLTLSRAAERLAKLTEEHGVRIWSVKGRFYARRIGGSLDRVHAETWAAAVNGLYAWVYESTVLEGVTVTRTAAGSTHVDVEDPFIAQE